MADGFFSRGFRGRRRSQDTALPQDSTWRTASRYSPQDLRPILLKRSGTSP